VIQGSKARSIWPFQADVELRAIEDRHLLTDRDSTAVWRWQPVKDTIAVAEPAASGPSRNEKARDRNRIDDTPTGHAADSTEAGKR
jgi:hypothetical protein